MNTKKYNKGKINPNYIDYNKQNCKEDNLVSLCTICHRTTAGNRKYWTIFFENLLKEKQYVHNI